MILNTSQVKVTLNLMKITVFLFLWIKSPICSKACPACKYYFMVLLISTYDPVGVNGSWTKDPCLEKWAGLHMGGERVGSQLGKAV